MPGERWEGHHSSQPWVARRVKWPFFHINSHFSHLAKPRGGHHYYHFMEGKLRLSNFSMIAYGQLVWTYEVFSFQIAYVLQKTQERQLWLTRSPQKEAAEIPTTQGLLQWGLRITAGSKGTKGFTAWEEQVITRCSQILTAERSSRWKVFCPLYQVISNTLTVNTFSASSSFSPHPPLLRLLVHYHCPFFSSSFWI